MKEIILAIILVMQVFTLCHISYRVYKRKIRIDAQYIWILIVTVFPIVGPIIYFTGKNSDTHF
jgi:hypothetical protein